MKDIQAKMMFAGLLLAGCGCALAVPFIPFRVSAWCVPLMLAALVVRKRAKSETLFALVAYTLFWMAGCTFAGTAGTFLNIPSIVLSAGLIVMLPIAISGFRRKAFLFDYRAGVIFSVLILAGFMSIVLFAKRNDPTVDLSSVVHLVLVFAAVCLVAAGVADAGRKDYPYPVTAVIMAVAVPLIALLATIGYWRTSALMAQNCIKKNRMAEAVEWTGKELKISESMAIPGALSLSLYRAVEIGIRTGNSNLWYSALSVIVENDPSDQEAVRALFAFSLKNNKTGSDVLKCFRLLPDRLIDVVSAEKIAAVSYSAGDWQSFARTVGILYQASALKAVRGIDWQNAAKVLYFRGDRNTAEHLLLNLPGAGRLDWESSRILFHILLSRKQTEDAAKVLADANSSGHEGEAVYLNALLSRERGDADLEKESLAKVLKNDPEHAGARRRLRELGIRPDKDPSLDVKGVVFDNSCRLVECFASPETLGRGDKLRLSFRWEIMAPLDPRWKVFVHFRQAVYGGFFFQADHRFRDLDQTPGGKGIGSLLKYETFVTVPSNAPPGSYSLTIGIWDGARNSPAVQAGGSEAAMKVVKGDRVLISRSITIRR